MVLDETMKTIPIHVWRSKYWNKLRSGLPKKMGKSKDRLIAGYLSHVCAHLSFYVEPDILNKQFNDIMQRFTYNKKIEMNFYSIIGSISHLGKMPGEGSPLWEANWEVPLDGVAFSSWLDWL